MFITRQDDVLLVFPVRGPEFRLVGVRTISHPACGERSLRPPTISQHSAHYELRE